MKKLQAFTLMEVLVGMIISSILIGFCYSGYRIISQQFLNYKNLKQEIVITMQFNSVFKTDFTNAKTIRTNDQDEHQVILIINDTLQLHYTFADNYILRQDKEVSDTFKISPSNLSIKRLSDTEESELQSLPEPQSSFINDLSFDAMVLKETEHFHFTKIYSAETMINK